MEGPRPRSPQHRSAVDLWALYKSAIRKARSFGPQAVRPLEPLSAVSGVKNVMVAWKTRGYLPLPGVNRTVRKETWASPLPEFRERVRQVFQEVERSEWELRLRQLLGLNPPRGLPLPELTHFALLVIDGRDVLNRENPRHFRVFRPCTNPDPTSERPFEMGKPEPDPRDASPEHETWIAKQTRTAYQRLNLPILGPGFPWTRMGYTYDWRPGADLQGLSEYVIQRGTPAVEVAVIDNQSFFSLLGLADTGHFGPPP